MNSSFDMDGMVLCGGKSSRMGQDKAFLKVGNETLLERQVSLLKSVGCRQVFVSGPSGRGYEQAKCPVISDERAEGGPMEGIHSVFKKSAASRLMVLAVDLPCLTLDFLAWISKFSGTRIPGSARGFEPLCAIYDREGCLPGLEGCIQRRDYSLQKWIQGMVEQGTVEMVTENEWKPFGKDLLLNWNEIHEFKPENER